MTFWEQWYAWGTRWEIRLVGLAFVLLLNVWATVRICFIRDMNRDERKFWITLVWAVPMAGLLAWFPKAWVLLHGSGRALPAATRDEDRNG